MAAGARPSTALELEVLPDDGTPLTSAATWAGDSVGSGTGTVATIAGAGGGAGGTTSGVWAKVGADDSASKANIERNLIIPIN